MLQVAPLDLQTIDDARAALQKAIALEFATLPAYLYAKFTIRPDTNAAAMANLSNIVGEEMIHFCLACNILNAIGGDPKLAAPEYPGGLPDGVTGVTVRLLPFSRDAMKQGMEIEAPVKPLDIPIVKALAAPPPTIAQFYAQIDGFLSQLDPRADWKPGRHQIGDAQFFQGQLFPVNAYADAQRAIAIIVSEGEGAKDTPLDFADDVSHYYRFAEMYHDKVLTKADNEVGYTFGPEALGVDYDAAYPAIADPGSHDFSNDPPEAQAAQQACNLAYGRLIDHLQAAVTGEPGRLGNAVRAMFDLRLAAIAALEQPLADGRSVAGPSFLYTPANGGTDS